MENTQTQTTQNIETKVKKEKVAKEFWMNFYEEMDMLKDVLNGYFQLLGEIPGNDEIFNDHELGQLETKIRELSQLISKKSEYKNYVKEYV